MLKSLKKFKLGSGVSYRGIKRYPNKNTRTEFNLERKKMQREMTQLRKQYLQEHWEEFTKRENRYLQEFEQTQFKAWRSREKRFRSSVIKIAMHTQRHLDYLREREIRMKERNRKRQLLHADHILTRKVMLDAMEIESKMWLSNQDFLKKLNAGKLLPASIHQQADYLQRLQQKSLLMQMGDYSRLEDLIDRREIIAFKNKLLAPIYQELKAAIRLMTYTEEYKILRSFQDLKNVIKAKHSGSTQESKKVLFELYLRHAQLLAKLHSEQSNPEVKLQVLEEQVDHIRTVLGLWEYYTYIIYLPDSQVYGMLEMELREELNETEKSIKNVKERFEEAKLGDEPGYKSVLEEETSDTSEAEDDLNSKHDIVREDLLGEMEGDELQSFTETQLLDQLMQKAQKTSSGFQFKNKNTELGFIKQKHQEDHSGQEETLTKGTKSLVWAIIENSTEGQKQVERFNKDEATVLSGTSQNFLDRSSYKDPESELASAKIGGAKSEDLFKMYEKSFLESQSDSLYGDEEEAQKGVDKMVEEMDFEKLGLRQFMEAQNLDQLYNQNPQFDAYERMRIQDTAKRMAEEMSLMKETLSYMKTPESPQEMHIKQDDQKRSAETAHVSLVVQHYLKQLSSVHELGLQPKYLAKKRGIMKKLEGMKEIQVTDPKILLKIHQRVGYKLPEFDLE